MASSGEGEALFADLVAAPTDDGPRLVYADWLQQQDDPVVRARGEYIALACSATRSSRRSARLDALLAQHEAAWLGPLAAILEHRIWDRGFLDEAQLHRGCPDDALTHPAWQTLRTLAESTDPRGGEPRVPRAPRLANLRKLFTNEGMLSRLASSDHAPAITELAVERGDGIPGRTGALFATSPCFAAVTKLHLARWPPSRLGEVARANLTLSVDAVGSLGSWFQWIASTPPPLRELRLLRWRGQHTPLFVRDGDELVVTADRGGRWSVLEVRWTERDDPDYRDAILLALERLPAQRLTRLRFSGPPRAAFDVARWQTRVRQALRGQDLE